MIDVALQPQLPPKKIAVIIDGKIQDMLHTDERLAAIFLSNPIIVDVTDIYDGNTMVGWDYDEETKTVRSNLE